MIHLSLQSLKANFEVEIYCTKIGHMVLESGQSYLEAIFEKSQETLTIVIKCHSIPLFDIK